MSINFRDFYVPKAITDLYLYGLMDRTKLRRLPLNYTYGTGFKLPCNK